MADGKSDHDTGPLPGWIRLATGVDDVDLSAARPVRSGESREVWDCDVVLAGVRQALVLSLYKHASLDRVNTSLPPAETARKCALAVAELPAHGIPTPRLLGWGERGDRAVVVCSRVDPAPWRPEVRLLAATTLARLHGLSLPELSRPLRELVLKSDPRQSRTTGGEGPDSGLRTLVHGDYFSANILPTADGLCIVDWETLALGDPMWDLGFLIGADHGLPEAEVASVIGAYAALAPIVPEVLMWHKGRWDSYFSSR